MADCPGRAEDQDAFFAGLDERWTQGVDWQVAIDGIPFADNPSFEGYMPNYAEAFEAIQARAGPTSAGTPDLDMDAEIASLHRGAARNLRQSRVGQVWVRPSSAAAGPINPHTRRSR